MGQSFHWMNQKETISELYGLTEEGGGLAVIGTEPVKQNSLSEKKNKVVREVTKKYLGPRRRAGISFYNPPKDRYEDLLLASRFKNFQQKSFTIKLKRHVDEILGHIFSTSYTSKALLGKESNDFEKEIRKELLEINPKGIFEEKITFDCYTVIK